MMFDFIILYFNTRVLFINILQKYKDLKSQLNSLNADFEKKKAQSTGSALSAGLNEHKEPETEQEALDDTKETVGVCIFFIHIFLKIF